MIDDGERAGGRNEGEPTPTRSETIQPASKPKPEAVDGERGGATEQQRVAESRSFRDPGEDAQALAPLFSGEEGKLLQDRWDEIQAAFVDDPRSAVEKADALVTQTTDRLQQMFSDERSALENQWKRGEGAGTEDLRLALRRYRSFFGRLLAI